jgi:hypothetical protein
MMMMMLLLIIIRHEWMPRFSGSIGWKDYLLSIITLAQDKLTMYVWKLLQFWHIISLDLVICVGVFFFQYFKHFTLSSSLPDMWWDVCSPLYSFSSNAKVSYSSCFFQDCHFAFCFLQFMLWPGVDSYPDGCPLDLLDL